ncbi:MAG: hypothetical protein JNK26_04405 [Candidatus Doudnabacteria bacterium]|nr:hypothetical protein [Candidatus Doudnabacteria bacterium]
MSSKLRKLNLQLVALTVVCGVFLLMPVSATAATLSELREEFESLANLSATQRQLKANELRSQSSSERCTSVGQNIQKRIDFYDLVHQDYAKRFLRIQTNLDLLNRRLVDLNVDTDNLERLIIDLRAQLRVFDAARNEVVFALTDAKQTICDTDQSNFRSQISSATSKLEAIRELATEIFELINEDIRTEIQGVNKQVQN